MLQPNPTGEAVVDAWMTFKSTCFFSRKFLHVLSFLWPKADGSQIQTARAEASRRWQDFRSASTINFTDIP